MKINKNSEHYILTNMPSEEQKKYMEKWFYENHEDPAKHASLIPYNKSA
jgi:hypothetical protein